MKKITILAICLFNMIHVHAQSYTIGATTFNVIPIALHDSTTCSSTYTPTYTITTDSTYVGDSIVVVDTATGVLVAYAVNTTGTSPWTVTLSLTGTTTDDYQSVGGVPGVAMLTDYVCYVAKLRHNTTRIYVVNTTMLSITNPCGYDTVSGWVYIDNNSNCIFDSGDVAINLPPVGILESVSSGSLYASGAYEAFSTGGWYKFWAQQSWMTSYTISLPSSWAFIFPLSSCDTLGYTRYFTTLPQSNVNFPLQCTSSIDLLCDALAPYNIRYGRSFYLAPFTTNTGCDTTSGTMTVVLDPRLIYNAGLSYIPADTVRGDTLIWNYSHLTNVSYGTAYWNSFLSNINLSLDSTVVEGDTLCFLGYTQIPTSDIDPLNNSFSFCMPVVNSYDPNEKTVSPAGTGTAGFIPATTDTLTYTIHFQNTGTASAINIHIIDTLDSHINAATLRIIGTSANMSPQWLAPGIVQFNFDNINLPDSGANWAASQGEVKYKVALHAGLAHGTQIKNTGYIYFDSNPAIVTNTTLNTIDTAHPTKVNTVVKAKEIRVYPNPATDYVTIENAGDATIILLDMNGVVVMEQSASGTATTLNVCNLPAGVYVIRTISSGQTTTTRFTKYR